MKLTKKQKQEIIDEYNEWFEKQYGNKTKKERQAIGAFFTPPELTIKMLEKFKTIKNKSILDPTMGAGGLLSAAIIAGANPEMIYGIELDTNIYNIAVERLTKLGVPKKNLCNGDALDSSSYIFD